MDDRNCNNSQSEHEVPDSNQEVVSDQFDSLHQSVHDTDSQDRILLKNDHGTPHEGPNQGNKASTDTENVKTMVDHDVSGVEKSESKNTPGHSKDSVHQSDHDTDSQKRIIFKNDHDTPHDGPNQGNKASTNTENVETTVDHDTQTDELQSGLVNYSLSEPNKLEKKENRMIDMTKRADGSMSDKQVNLTQKLQKAYIGDPPTYEDVVTSETLKHLDEKDRIQTERHEQVTGALGEVNTKLGQFQEQMAESNRIQTERHEQYLEQLRRLDRKPEETQVQFDSKHNLSDDDDVLVKTTKRPCKRCGCRSTCRCRCHSKGDEFKRHSNDSDDDIGDRNFMETKKHRRSKVEKSKLLGASGGQPGGSSDDPSDDSDDSKKRGYKRQRKIRRSRKKGEWIIDSRAWGACISQKATGMIDYLICEKKLPDNAQLHEANKFFETDHVKKICNAICQYIYHRSEHIKYVYSGHRFHPTSRTIDREQITFIAISEKYVKFGNEFYVEGMTLDVYKQASDKSRYLENETSKLTQCLRNHSKTLMEKHSNVCRISCGLKSIDNETTKTTCIALYVYSKKYIPLGEDLMPKTYEIDDDQLVVDVREGFVEAYSNDDGPYDRLDHLQMGCSISGGLFKDGKPQCGTLGGFFEDGQTDCCLSSCHAFLSAKQMEQVMKTERVFLGAMNWIERRETFQPYDSHHNPFGQGQMAVYIEGGNGSTGVDVISIEINDRNPEYGGFPRNAKGITMDKVFSEGAIYDRKKIHDLLEIDKDRRFYKYGCRTGWTSGMFRFDGASFRFPHPVQNGKTQFNICLHNQFEILSESDNDFAEKEDSGALVFIEDKDKLVAIGMVEAGMAGEVCFVTPLDEIFKSLRLNHKNGLKNFNSVVDRSVSVDSGILPDSQSVKEEMSTVKSDINSVKHEISGINDRMCDLMKRSDSLQNDVGDIKGSMCTMMDLLTQMHASK